MNLRPYQTELITAIRLQYQLGHRKVLAVLPTGAGKTVCFSHIAQSAARKGNRVLIAVHRQELLDQACRSLPMPHGVIAANRAMDLSAAVQVASVQTLARRLHKLPRDFFQLVIIDEAHHSNAGTWAKALDHFQQAHLLGVTATPIRLDGRGLGEHYQAMVEGPSAAWLTDNGYLASARVLAPPGFDTTGLRKRMGDFDTREAEHRIGTIMGDCLSHYRKHLNGQTAIAFCCSVAHAEAVAALFQCNGIPAASIDGSMDAGTRRELLSDLGTGRIKVLTSCALIGEGVDVPSVGGCILLRPTQSVSLHLQMLGRCLRPSGDKVAVILDHVGNTLRLGHYLEPREWTLEGIKKRDKESAPSVRVCPQCFAAMFSTAKQCAECGHVFTAERREIKQVNGELVEIAMQSFAPGDAVECYWGTDEGWFDGFEVVQLFDDWNRLGICGSSVEVKATRPSLIGEGDVAHFDLKRVRKPIRALKREQGKAQSMDQLIALGRERGYKNPTAWAKHVFNARQHRTL
jgi:DNA repair protein RadD